MGLLWVEPMESQGSSEMEERGRIVGAGEGVRQKVPTVGRGMGGGGRSPPQPCGWGPPYWEEERTASPFASRKGTRLLPRSPCRTSELRNFKGTCVFLSHEACEDLVRQCRENNTPTRCVSPGPSPPGPSCVALPLPAPALAHPLPPGWIRRVEQRSVDKERKRQTDTWGAARRARV